MAMEDFEIKHQPYIKFLTSTSTKEGVYKVGIDSDLTMKEMLDNLIGKLDGQPILHDGTPVGPEFLILLDSNHEECDLSTYIKDHSCSSKTFTLDYKDHVVLQFSTLGQDSAPQLKFKFLPYEIIDVENTKAKNTKK